MNSLFDLVKCFHLAFIRAGPQNIDMVLKNNSRLLMAYFRSGAKDWHSLVYPSTHSYSKLWVSTGGPFDIAVMTWMPTQQTQIHTHPEHGCLMMPLIGSLNEDRYVSNPALSNQYSHLRSRILVPGDIAYMDNKLGAHKVRNTTDKVAVSLHVYCDGLKTDEKKN